MHSKETKKVKDKKRKKKKKKMIEKFSAAIHYLFLQLTIQSLYCRKKREQYSHGLDFVSPTRHHQIFSIYSSENKNMLESINK
jgi:hypothetical protein